MRRKGLDLWDSGKGAGVEGSLVQGWQAATNSSNCLLAFISFVSLISTTGYYSFFASSTMPFSTSISALFPFNDVSTLS